MQEANNTFGKINEALRKLETKGHPDNPEGNCLQLLRQDLGTQGDTLSMTIQGLCSDIRSTSKHYSGNGLDADVRLRQGACKTVFCGPAYVIWTVKRHTKGGCSQGLREDMALKH